jgi:hypothetical protein
MKDTVCTGSGDTRMQHCHLKLPGFIITVSFSCMAILFKHVLDKATTERRKWKRTHQLLVYDNLLNKNINTIKKQISYTGCLVRRLI